MSIKELAGLWQASLEDKDFRFELKAQAVAVELAAAVADAGLSQKELAERLGWKPSRVSKVLHGATNVTLRTLFDLYDALGLDFSIAAEARQQPDNLVLLDVAQCGRGEVLPFRVNKRTGFQHRLCDETIVEFAS